MAAGTSRKAKRKLARDEKKQQRHKRQRGEASKESSAPADGSTAKGGGRRGKKQHQGGRPRQSPANGIVNRFQELLQETVGDSGTAEYMQYTEWLDVLTVVCGDCSD